MGNFNELCTTRLCKPYRSLILGTYKWKDLVRKSMRGFNEGATIQAHVHISL